jgi:UrcA family protein
VPDADLGERVVGFVCLATGRSQYLVDDILASARAQLADYKVPEYLQVVAEIPRNSIGKIDRASLRGLPTVALPPAAAPRGVFRHVAPLLAALVVALCTLVPNARADGSERVSVMVRYGDLDLSTRQGVDTLHQRIRSAAKHVCGDETEPGDLARYAAFRNCVRIASNKALEKVQVQLSQVEWVVK